jgi:hypothetical protein
MKASFGRKEDMLAGVGRCRFLSIRRFVGAEGCDGVEERTWNASP